MDMGTSSGGTALLPPTSTVSYLFLALFTLLRRALPLDNLPELLLGKNQSFCLRSHFLVVMARHSNFRLYDDPQTGVQSQISGLGSLMSRWGEEHGRLPATLQEIASAETGSLLATNGAR